MSTASDTRPPTKGVEFSDHLIVLGASPAPFPSTSQTYSYALPKAPAFVHRGQVAARHNATDVFADPPDKPRSISARFEHTVVGDDDSAPTEISPSVPFRTPGKRHARFFEHAPELITDEMVTPPQAYDEPLETSCTDSEEDHLPSPDQLNEKHYPQPDQAVERCTRINTKLNSLPSGGAFSFMNSSEDVDLSSSDDEHLSASRKLIRVQGSAKLSSASGLGEEAFDIDEDEFAIEGAEKVEEEEAVNVRSFGRSFARVCLKDELDDVEEEQPIKYDKEKSRVVFDLPADKVVEEEKVQRVDDGPTSDSASALSASGQKKVSQNVLTESRSAPPRRKSRLRLTFVRRASVADTKESKAEPSSKLDTTPTPLEDSVSGVTKLSCFPVRRSPTRQRTRNVEITRPRILSATETAKDNVSGKRPPVPHRANQIVAIPEFDIQKMESTRNRKSKKMVKNISMQRDDWIDFATNAPHRQRSQWLARFKSHNGCNSDTSSRRDSRGVASEATDTSRNSGGWKFWRFWRHR